MLALIKKDLEIGKLFQLGIFIIIPLVTSLIYVAFADRFEEYFIGIFILGSIFLCIMYSFVFIGIDSGFHTDQIYASLPVRRAEIVYARYVTSMIQVTVNFSLVILSGFLSMYFLENTNPLLDNLLSFRGILSINIFLLVILAFILPSVFKYGAGNGFTALLIILFCLILSGPAVRFVFQLMNGIWEFDLAYFIRLLNDIFSWLMGLHPGYTYLIVFTNLLIVIFISVRLSVRFYIRREI